MEFQLPLPCPATLLRKLSGAHHLHCYYTLPVNRQNQSNSNNPSRRQLKPKLIPNGTTGGSVETTGASTLPIRRALNGVH
jgi:hypothetical protein